VVLSEAMGLAGPAARFGAVDMSAQNLTNTQWSKCSGCRLPEGVATVVEVLMELNGMHSAQESDSETWTMQSARMTMVIFYVVGLRQQSDSDSWRQATHRDHCADCWVE